MHSPEGKALLYMNQAARWPGSAAADRSTAGQRCLKELTFKTGLPGTNMLLAGLGVPWT